MNPIDMLIAQTAESASAFAENSRYRHVGTATTTLPDGREVSYVRRRFLPPPESIQTMAEHTVLPDDRLDNLAYDYHKDPELFWRICDANRILRPNDLTDNPDSGGVARVIRIGMPKGT